MKASFIVFIVLLAACGVLLYYGFNHQWDPETEPEPVISPSTWWQWTCLVVGAVLAVGVIVGYTMFAIAKTRKFYAVQEVYWKTKEYAKQKEKALKVDLHKFKKGQLKWYKKMGYITAVEMRKVLDESRNMKDKEKTKKN